MEPKVEQAIMNLIQECYSLTKKLMDYLERVKKEIERD